MKGEFEVIGIASDATLDDPRAQKEPAIYVSLFQRPDYLGWSEAIVRTSGDPVRLSRALTAKVESLGHEYPLRIETVSEEYNHALRPERVLYASETWSGFSQPSHTKCTTLVQL